jgi:hypothetical protein
MSGAERHVRGMAEHCKWLALGPRLKFETELGIVPEMRLNMGLVSNILGLVLFWCWVGDAKRQNESQNWNFETLEPHDGWSCP